ncbi:MAG: response regulator [Planctomycetota bacterium]
MSKNESVKRAVRTIRSAEAVINKLLDQADAAEPSPPETQRYKRFKYRVKGLVVALQQPGDATFVPFLVPSRDLSAEGMSFLHGGFVHVGARCQVQLISAYGTWTNMLGSIVRCRYLEGGVHEVGVRFDGLIDPAEYCPTAVRSRILLVEDDPFLAKLVLFHLKQLNVEVDHVVDGKKGVETALSQAYDLVLMDVELPELDGLSATRELRRRGYAGRIVAATARTEPTARQKCLEAGCDGYLSKPYTREQLALVMQSLREEPLYSAFHHDSSMLPLIASFVEELPSIVRSMEEAVEKQDLSKVEGIARQLKAHGASFGFDVISEHAKKIEQSLLGGTNLDDVRKEITDLMRLCFQARAPVVAKARQAGEPKAQSIS